MTTPSTEMTKRHIDMLLSFQIMLMSWDKFLHFVIFSLSVLGRLWVKRTAVSITSGVLFSPSMSNISGLVLLSSLALLLVTHFFSSGKRKYLFNALVIVCELLVDIPSIFKTCLSSVIFFLLDSNFIVSQMVLILL